MLSNQPHHRGLINNTASSEPMVATKGHPCQTCEILECHLWAADHPSNALRLRTVY